LQAAGDDAVEKIEFRPIESRAVRVMWQAPSKLLVVTRRGHAGDAYRGIGRATSAVDGLGICGNCCSGRRIARRFGVRGTDRGT
jgi:hypothetical protein